MPIEIDGVNNKIDLDDDKDTSISANVDDTLVVEVGGNTLATVTSSSVTINDNTTITTADNTDTLSLISTDDDANVGPVLRLFRNSASAVDNDTIGNIIFSGNDTAGNETDYLTFQVNAGDADDGQEDGFMRILMPVASSSTEFVRLSPAEVVFNEGSANLDFRVESDGNANMFIVDAGANSVFMNTNSALGNGVLQIEGQGKTNCIVMDSDSSSGGFISFEYGDSIVGNINTNGSITSYVTSSDYRLKENVNYDFDATTELKKLKPAKFNFKTDANKTVNGFLAHEVSDIVPEAVSGEKDAVDEDGNIKPQGIDQSKLVPLMVKTIQELEARITELENE